MATKKQTKKVKPVEEDLSTSAINVAALSDEEKTRRSLESKPKVSFMIPLEPKEPAGSIETVIINGYRIEIPKGKIVSVPQPVAEILANKYKVEMEVGERMRIDRTKETRDALE